MKPGLYFASFDDSERVVIACPVYVEKAGDDIFRASLLDGSRRYFTIETDNPYQKHPDVFKIGKDVGLVYSVIFSTEAEYPVTWHGEMKNPKKHPKVGDRVEGE